MASQPQTQKIYWFLILVFVLFSMTVGTVGYFLYEQQKRILKKEKWDQVSAIGDMKVHQIFEWRKERLGDAAIIKGRLKFIVSGLHY